MSLSPWPALLRAGAFGAVQGGHPGHPTLGVTVPVTSPADLRRVLSTLEASAAQVTLLCPPELARLDPEGLWAAARAGQEVAGLGHPTEPGLLLAVTGQLPEFWRLTTPRGEDLRRLAAWGVRVLPAPRQAEPGAAEPGAIVEARPGELAARLADWRRRGYRPQPVGQLPGLRSGTPADLGQAVYARLVEDRFSEQHRVIDLTERADGLMRVAPLDHAPAPLPLPRDTPTAELHLHSPRLVGLASRNALATYRAYVRSLSDVGAALQTRPELAGARAVFAVTLLYSPLEKAGFTLLDLPPWQARWYGLGFRLLRMAYGTLRPPGDALPRMAWMDREAFLARYGKPGLSRAE